LPLKKERATTKAHTAHQKCKNLSNNQNPRTTLPSDFFSNIEAVADTQQRPLFFILSIFRHTSRRDT
jgi:hypothetical protein